METINNIIKHYMNNLDKVFTINFTLLAFIITAITILTALNKGVIEEFKEAKLMDKINNKFKRALDYNLLSGVIAFIGFYLNIDNFFYQIVIFILTFILFIKSLYWTYKTYDWIIFFINYSK